MYAKPAIIMKLKDSNRSDTLLHYLPGEAQDSIPNLEIFGGLIQLGIPIGNTDIVANRCIYAELM